MVYLPAPTSSLTTHNTWHDLHNVQNLSICDPDLSDRRLHPIVDTSKTYNNQYDDNESMVGNIQKNLLGIQNIQKLEKETTAVTQKDIW